MELRKIEGNGVELEVKFKVQWRWSEVDVKTSGVGVERKFQNGGGMEVEEEISNLGTLFSIIIQNSI